MQVKTKVGNVLNLPPLKVVNSMLCISCVHFRALAISLKGAKANSTCFQGSPRRKNLVYNIRPFLSYSLFLEGIRIIFINVVTLHLGDGCASSIVLSIWYNHPFSTKNPSGTILLYARCGQ